MSAEEIYLMLTVLGFIFLVVCLTLIVIATLKTLNAITETCLSLEKQINVLEIDAGKIFHQVTNFSENINYKMKCLDPYFHTIHQFGERIEEQAAKKREEDLIEYLKEKVNAKEDSTSTPNQVLEFADVAIRCLDLFNKFKKRR